MNLMRLTATPSFYLWTTWCVVALILAFPPMATEMLSLKTILVVALVILCGLASNLLFQNAFYRAASNANVKVEFKATLLLFIATTCLGALGLMVYLTYVINTLGGWGNYIYLLFHDPLRIRAVSIDDLGGAVQLTYLSWVSFTLAVFIFARTRAPWQLRFLALGIGIAEFLTNMTFIDRTRPVWLVVVGSVALVFSSRNPMKYIKMMAYLLPITILAIFIFFANFTQKVTTGGVFDTLAQYMLGGILYLNHILDMSTSLDYLPSRTFYPIAKVLEAIGLVEDVPSQILDFRYVPFASNVGTFVEPLFSDGGFVFMVLGIPAVILATDALALWGLRSNTPMGVFVYANLLFSDMIAFFVPKFVATPVYLFVGLFVVLRLLKTMDAGLSQRSRAPLHNTFK